MENVCKTCGMIKDLCVCELLDKEKATKIRVYTTAKKFKKLVTVVAGMEKTRLEQTASELKHHLACGGTAKNGLIVLQGDHKQRILSALIKMGYARESIEVS